MVECKRVGRVFFFHDKTVRSHFIVRTVTLKFPEWCKNHKKLRQVSSGAHKNTLLSLWNSEICRKRCRAIKKVSIKVGSALDRPPWSSFPWQCRGVWCGEQKGWLPWWSLAAISRCPSSLERERERGKLTADGRYSDGIQKKSWSWNEDWRPFPFTQKL